LNKPTLSIIFLCSSLEPGKDGVGDYTRKLACALNKSGHLAAVISINDRRLENGAVWEGVQTDEMGETKALRLSSMLPWDERMQRAKDWIEKFDPQWLSLQYVPFGFHLKGLPFKLGNKLKLLTGHRRWQLMFHELSVNRFESFKFRVWSYLQMKIIRSLLHALQPVVVHTNTELYQRRLQEMGYNAMVLPLFSNISWQTGVGANGFEKIIPAFISRHREDYIIGTLFGSFDFKQWDMRSLLDKFNYRYSKKRVVMVSLGRMSAGGECWEQLKYEYPLVTFLSLGEQPAAFISYWLMHYTTFGILTTMPELSGKSGSYMAFKEHGVPVVCREKTASLQSLYLPVEKDLVQVDAATAFQLPGRRQPVVQLETVLAAFVESLAAAAGIF
jgi:hypothetical protein